MLNAIFFIARRFLQRAINVLILTWETFTNMPEVNADWILYFDLPPDNISYVLSVKYGNCVKNEHVFLVEEGNEDVKKKVEPFRDLSCLFQEVGL